MTTRGAENLYMQFRALFRTQGKEMAVHVSWADGGGYILITRKKWDSLTEDERVKLIAERLETLYRRVQKKQLASQ